MSDSMVQRETLPVPDPTHVGLTTFDAKDPNTVYPPIVPSASSEPVHRVLQRCVQQRHLRHGAPLSVSRAWRCSRRCVVQGGQLSD